MLFWNWTLWGVKHWLTIWLQNQQQLYPPVWFGRGNPLGRRQTWYAACLIDFENISHLQPFCGRQKKEHGYAYKCSYHTCYKSSAAVNRHSMIKYYLVTILIQYNCCLTLWHSNYSLMITAFRYCNDPFVISVLWYCYYSIIIIIYNNTAGKSVKWESSIKIIHYFSDSQTLISACQAPQCEIWSNKFGRLESMEAHTLIKDTKPHGVSTMIVFHPMHLKDFSNLVHVCSECHSQSHSQSHPYLFGLS